MSFGDAIRTCLGKYATFEGRARRSEFWWFYLFIVIIETVLYVPILLISVGAANSNSTVLNLLVVLLWIVFAVVAIGLIIPQLSVGCRRLHDRGMSGWLQLLLLVPCGGIVLLVMWALEGNPGNNAYGPPAA